MIIALVVIAVLIAVGAFFFTFEEFDEEEEGYDQSSQVQEDPYAWAKAKQVPAITTQPAAQAVAQPSVVQQTPVQETPQQSSQHPGWLWDAQTNQWVPDPNYVHNK
mgnify:FL=1